jgi:hypothetical protein
MQRVFGGRVLLARRKQRQFRVAQKQPQATSLSLVSSPGPFDFCLPFGWRLIISFRLLRLGSPSTKFLLGYLGQLLYYHIGGSFVKFLHSFSTLVALSPFLCFGDNV